MSPPPFCLFPSFSPILHPPRCVNPTPNPWNPGTLHPEPCWRESWRLPLPVRPYDFDTVASYDLFRICFSSNSTYSSFLHGVSSFLHGQARLSSGPSQRRLFRKDFRPEGTFFRTIASLLSELWEGFRESRRCSRDTYPESYITKYTCIRRYHTFSLPTIHRCVSASTDRLDINVYVAPIGCTSCIVKSFRSRRSFILSPLWTPEVCGPTS